MLLGLYAGLISQMYLFALHWVTSLSGDPQIRTVQILSKLGKCFLKRAYWQKTGVVTSPWSKSVPKRTLTSMLDSFGLKTIHDINVTYYLIHLIFPDFALSFLHLVFGFMAYFWSPTFHDRGRPRQSTPKHHANITQTW